MTIKKSLFLIAPLLLVASFQNCAKVGFSSASPALKTSGNPDTPDGPITPDEPPQAPPTSTPPPIDITETGDFECKSQILLTPDVNGNLDVPPRATDGVCYSIKILSAISRSSSALARGTDAEIVSRDHDGNSPGGIRHPYIMGEALLSVLMRGPRSIKVAGDSRGTAPILVDNFVFVRIGFEGQSEAAAYGTSDSSIPGTDYIMFNEKQVSVVPFGSSGTSTITPLQLEGHVPINRTFNLDVRALDCGSIREASDLYLVFQ